MARLGHEREERRIGDEDRGAERPEQGEGDADAPGGDPHEARDPDERVTGDQGAISPEPSTHAAEGERDGGAGEDPDSDAHRRRDVVEPEPMVQQRRTEGREDREGGSSERKREDPEFDVTDHLDVVRLETCGAWRGPVTPDEQRRDRGRGEIDPSPEEEWSLPSEGEGHDRGRRHPEDDAGVAERGLEAHRTVKFGSFEFSPDPRDADRMVEARPDPG